MKPKIVLTGGGTAGHVTPNIALIEVLQEEGWQIDYVGSVNGVEKNMISALGIPYHGISSGKLRRYFSWQNFLDPVKIIWGIIQTYLLLSKLKPDIVFSKGGFVAFPVVVAAWLHRIPVIAHESDISPGLANRLSFPFVNKICLTFDAATRYFKQQKKIEVTGTPIRQVLFQGSVEKGLQRCGFTTEKPCVLVMGGSQGASSMNTFVRQALDKLCARFQVIHLCGRGKIDLNFTRVGYCQFEYAEAELADFFAASDVIISRAGANSLYEILALTKPHILIPLSGKVSRGDQIQNAGYFQKQSISLVLDEATMTAESLAEMVFKAHDNQHIIKDKIKTLNIQSATNRIMSLIKETSGVGLQKTV